MGIAVLDYVNKKIDFYVLQKSALVQYRTSAKQLPNVFQDG